MSVVHAASAPRRSIKDAATCPPVRGSTAMCGSSVRDPGSTRKAQTGIVKVDRLLREVHKADFGCPPVFPLPLHPRTGTIVDSLAARPVLVVLAPAVRWKSAS